MTLTNWNQWENLTNNFLSNILILFHLLSLNMLDHIVIMLGEILIGIRITFMVMSLQLGSTVILILMEISARKRL